MAILKGLWSFLVGVKDFLVLLLMLLIFAAIFAGLNYEQDAPALADNGALTIPLDGYLVTQAQEIDPFQLISGGPTAGEIETAKLISVIEAAKDDEDIETIVLDLDGFLGGGLADIQDVGNALAEFRESGKTVVSFATAYLDSGWLLAAHSDEIWLSPLGAVFVQGPGGSQLYFGDALDKLNVDINVFRVGTYKSAVEPLIQNAASEPAKRANQALVDDLWENYQEDVAAARPQAKLAGYVADVPGRVRAASGDFAQAALAAGLVDHLGSRAEFEREMANRVGEDEEAPGGYLSTAYSAYAASVEPAASGDAVGIVTVAGNIVDGEAGPGTAGGQTVADLIGQAVADEDIKALVVRVDSPGGSVMASEQIRQALIAAKAEGLPVVASFGPVAASGGYWVSTAADTVFAQPTTITGSIGVFAVIPSFENALSDLGINADGVQTTPLSGSPDVFAGLSDTTRDVFQLSVEDIYRRFTGIVAEARDMPRSRVEEIAEGRVWSGAAARQLGLVDRFGTLSDAVAAAETAAGYEPGELRRAYVRQPKPLPVQIVESMLSPDKAEEAHSAADLAAAAQRAQFTAALDDVMTIADGPALQAHCLACAAYSPRTVTKPLPGWLEAARAFLD